VSAGSAVLGWLARRYDQCVRYRANGGEKKSWAALKIELESFDLPAAILVIVGRWI
jgi:hypothetical protein